MAREIWIKADVRGFELDEMGQFRPLATCGLHDLARGELIWANPGSIGDILSLECRAKGIVNSSNTALVMLKDGNYAPLGRADGKTEVRCGMQFRLIRNEMSRDHEIDFLPSRENAEKWCLLMSAFRGVKGNLLSMLELNHVKPEFVGAKRLAHLYTAISALSIRDIPEFVEIPKEIL